MLQIRIKAKTREDLIDVLNFIKTPYSLSSDKKNDVDIEGSDGNIIKICKLLINNRLDLPEIEIIISNQL